MGLMTFEEMKNRYNGGEDSFVLTLDKWERILQNSNTLFHLEQFQEILKAAVVPIFLCVEYENQCQLCPIFDVCKQGHSEDWVNLMRVVQAYAIAGDILPKDTFHGQVEKFVKKLRDCHETVMAKMH